MKTVVKRFAAGAERKSNPKLDRRFRIIIGRIISISVISIHDKLVKKLARKNKIIVSFSFWVWNEMPFGFWQNEDKACM